MRFRYLGVVSGFGSGLVSGLVFGVLGFTFVFDISDITVGVSGIGDDLDTTVGKVDSVRSLGVVSVAGFSGLEVSVAVSVLDSVVVSVLGRDIGVGGFVVSGGGGVVGGGLVSGHAGDEGKDSDL